MLLAFEPLWLCAEIRAAQVGAARAAAVLFRCKTKKRKEVLRIAAAYTQCEPAAAAASLYSDHRRGRHYYQRGGSGRHECTANDVNLTQVGPLLQVNNAFVDSEQPSVFASTTLL